MSRASLETAPGGGVTADLLQKAANTPNTDVLKNSGLSPDSKFGVQPNLVKGTRWPGEETCEDFDKISSRRIAAEKTFMASIQKSMRSPEDVIAGLSSQFAGPLGALLQSNPYYQLSKWAQTIDKNFTLTSPLGSGLVPFDLVAPTLLIYPVFSPFRNRIPRPQGQGTSHRAKVITSVLGSQGNTFANPSQRISISELVGGSLATWPNQLPTSGSQTAVDVNIPYKFFGLTEAVSWLSQFSGQGFDDVAALASLILLQEVMMAEERAIIGSTGSALSAPGITSGTGRGTVSGEVALSGVSQGDIFVYTTSVNYYGESLPSATSGPIAVSAGQVVDLTLPATPAGALALNIYVGTTSTDPGSAGTFRFATAVGATTYTLQGALPTQHQLNPPPPTVDTGTSATTDYEGIFSILSGHAQTAGVYPAGYQGGYIETLTNDTLNINSVSNSLQQVYNGSSAAFYADPSEIWAHSYDAKNLSVSLAAQGAGATNYRILVDMNEVNNAVAGVAVSRFTNPVTRSTVNITVHPYWPQGSAAGLSYTLPQTQNNISNVWENVMVQDYISINWPVIDITFRYSLFFYGTLFCPAPQYNFLMQGIQKSATKPYS